MEEADFCLRSTGWDKRFRKGGFSAVPLLPPRGAARPTVDDSPRDWRMAGLDE